MVIYPSQRAKAHQYLHHSHIWQWQHLPAAVSSLGILGLHGYYTWHKHLLWSNHAGGKRQSGKENTVEFPDQKRDLKIKKTKTFTQPLADSKQKFGEFQESSLCFPEYKCHLLSQFQEKNIKIFRHETKDEATNGSLPHWHCYPLAYISAETSSNWSQAP